MQMSGMFVCINVSRDKAFAKQETGLSICIRKNISDEVPKGTPRLPTQKKGLLNGVIKPKKRDIFWATYS